MIKADAARFVKLGLISAALLTSGCDLSDEIERRRAEDTATSEPDPAQSPTDRQLPKPVSEKLAEIEAVLETGSLRQLVRLAEQYENFRSNYGNIDTYRHWYIQKRAGLDPIEKTRQILDQPYGVKDFGLETYYVWPALAVRAPEDLDFSRLSFSERAALQELVGDAGIERMRAGEAYPGFRLAIRDDGEWVYLLADN